MSVLTKGRIAKKPLRFKASDYFDHKFIKDSFKMMWPVVVQSILIALINMVDTMFISNLIGEDATAGVGSSNAIFQLILFTIISACVAGGIFTSQYLGAQNIQRVKESVLWKIILSFSLILVLTGILTATALAPGEDKGLFYFFLSNNAGPNSAALKHGKEYWSIIIYSFIFLGFILPIQFTFVEHGRPLIPMFVSLGAFAINCVLNPLFMTGYNGNIKQWTFDNYVSGDAMRRYIEDSLKDWDAIVESVKSEKVAATMITGDTAVSMQVYENILAKVQSKDYADYNAIFNALSYEEKTVVVDHALWNIPGAILRESDILNHNLQSQSETVHSIENLRSDILAITTTEKGLSELNPQDGLKHLQMDGVSYAFIEYDDHNIIFRVSQWGMGVKGAAWGTFASRMFECIAYLSMCLWMKSVRDAFSPLGRVGLHKDLGAKVGTNFLKIGFSDILFSVSLGAIQIIMIKLGGPTAGDLGMKAIVITMTVVNLFYAIFQGYRTCVPYYVGTRLGAGDIEGAKLAFKRFCGLALILTSLLALALLFIGLFAMNAIFRLPPNSDLASYVAWHTAWHALGFFFLSFTMIFLSVLRVGGKAMLASILDVLSAYVFIVGFFAISLGISRAVLETGEINWVGVKVALVGNAVGEFAKCVILGIAVSRTDWARNLVSEDTKEATVDAKKLAVEV